MSTDLFDRYAALDPANEAGAVPDWQSAEARVLLAAIDERTAEMQTDRHTDRAVEPQRRRGGIVVAAAAFAVVIVVGAIALLATRNEPDAATTDALAVKDAYFAAFEAGNIDAMLALFSPEIEVTTGLGSSSLGVWERLYTWKSAEGTLLTPAQCEATTGDGLGDLDASFYDDPTDVVLTCEYAHHPYRAALVGAPATAHTLTMTVTAEGMISLLRDRFLSPSWPAEGPFEAWLEKVHPEDRLAVICCGWADVEEARTTGRLGAEHAEEWAAYLEASGCAWDDQTCVLNSN